MSAGLEGEGSIALQANEVCQPGEWNALVEASGIPSILQRWAWGEMKRATGMSVIRLVGETPEGAWASQAWKARSLPIWWSPEGPFRVPQEALLPRRAATRIPFGLCVLGSPFPESIGGAPLGVAMGVHIFHAENVLVDLRATENHLRHGMQTRWGRRLRSAERAGVVGGGLGLQEAFEFLDRELPAAERRKGFRSSWTSESLRHAGSFVELRAFGARSKGRLMAATIVGIDGPDAIALSAVVSKEGLAIFAGYVSHWHSILGTRAAGCAVFNLGGVDPIRNRGVADFKKRSGGTIVQMPGTFVYGGGPIVTAVAKRVAEYLPHFLTP